MKTVACLAALVGSAAAFAPAQQGASSTALSGAFDNEIGVQAPLGFFDPLGYLQDEDQERFEHLRWVELKHGRVAMLGVVGYLTTYAGIRFPGAEDVPAGFAALPAVPGMVWAQFIATVALMEAANRSQEDTDGVKAGWKPEFQGDFRNGFVDFGWDKQSDAWKKNKRAIELNQGRAAQMGLLGLMVHDQLGNIKTILPLGPQ
eukprot:CAMPEP_0181055618 /NCGR_PEP_ID=MMETSP1070-20121207/19293_1 /TAXON_ID=265543 /ORGANISM="Minutocellus polymorphus, Strain NH13" /LENGTH=202 /DNA_ID=CAMNT_0023134937 /DNA_START=18 /DNA_END=626 /DNA_ORIENTATION=+